MKIGIDLGGSHVTIGLVDDNYEIIEKRTYYMKDNNSSSFENYITNSIVQGTNEILTNIGMKLSEIEKIGIATPGNPKDGYIKNVVNLGIKEFNLVESLTKAFETEITGDKIFLGNDGKCAGLAEKYKGALREYSDCVFLCIGTGIGGAAFINNQFLKPKRNCGFEFGHMVIKKDGEQCKCGNKGCFEAYCSKRKFKEKMQTILGANNYMGAKELIQKINENIEKPEVNNLLEEYVDNLSLGIANIINLLEPEAIAIGGSMAHYDDLILEILRKKIYSGTYLFNKENPPKIIPALAGNDAGIIGATLI